MAPEAEEPTFGKEKLFQTRFLAQARPERIQMHWKEVAKLLDSCVNGSSGLCLGRSKWRQSKAGSLILEQSTGYDICEVNAGERRQASRREDGSWQDPRGHLQRYHMNTWCASGRTHRIDVFPKCKLGKNRESGAPGGKRPSVYIHVVTSLGDRAHGSLCTLCVKPQTVNLTQTQHLRWEVWVTIQENSILEDGSRTSCGFLLSRNTQSLKNCAKATR